ncbi:hypothetical protein BDF22DRAFT_115800 [Syncephalis plumigaleata]|nr:hypothetical protein BDF22DRAFT_115800 [Syncephalis plumigaleata]
MSSQVELLHTIKFLIAKGIQAVEQETPNELNSEEEEQPLDEITLSRIYRFLEEKDHLTNELNAVKDQYHKLVHATAEICCRNASLTCQPNVANETSKRQSSCIDQFEGKNRQQQQKGESACCTEEAEHQGEKSDSKKSVLDIRELLLNQEQWIEREEHTKEIDALNARIDEYSTKLEESGAVIDVLSQALSDYGREANFAGRLLSEATGRYRLVKWGAVRHHLNETFARIRRYLDENLTNSVAEEKKLKGTIVVYKYNNDNNNDNNNSNTTPLPNKELANKWQWLPTFRFTS